jgi:outer membrane protein assembly factor BamA
VLFGLSLASSFTFPSNEETKISNAVLTSDYTTKNQLMFNLKSNVFTPGNKWILNGDWRFYISSQPTYGLGIGYSKDTENSLFGREQPMEFDLLRFHQTVSHNIYKNLFIGFGVYYDRYTNIFDQALNLEEDQPVYTSHYLYNSAKGFDLNDYESMAFGLSLIHESRDIPTNAYSGWYGNITYKFYPGGLSNTYGAGLLNLDFRDYIKLDRKRNSMLALWFLGSFTTYGKLPYMNLMALGWDQKGTSGRGYKQGRFRGENYMYTEAEYRIPVKIDKQHPDRYGFVAFVNLSTASSSIDQIPLFEKFAPGYGAGFRIMLKKLTRSNITIDYGRGSDGTGNVYINFYENF